MPIPVLVFINSYIIVILETHKKAVLALVIRHSLVLQRIKTNYILKGKLLIFSTFESE